MPMSRPFHLICASLVAGVFAAPVAAQEFMTGEELLATIPGAVLTGISNEDGQTRWVQEYHPGGRSGRASGTYDKGAYTSKWSVRRDLWCEEWGSRSGCWRMERVGESHLQPWSGDRKLPNAWEILTTTQE